MDKLFLAMLVIPAAPFVIQVVVACISATVASSGDPWRPA